MVLIKSRTFSSPSTSILAGVSAIANNAPSGLVDAGVGRLSRQHHRDEQRVGVEVLELALGLGIGFAEAHKGFADFGRRPGLKGWREHRGPLRRSRWLLGLADRPRRLSDLLFLCRPERLRFRRGGFLLPRIRRRAVRGWFVGPGASGLQPWNGVSGVFGHDRGVVDFQ